MKIYLAIGGNKKVHAFAEKYGCSWLLTPENARKIPNGTFCADNGWFHAEKHDKPWSESRFRNFIERYPGYDFVVCPDHPIIEKIEDKAEERKKAMESLRYSISFIGTIPGPVYLAVQDGMTELDIRPYVPYFDGLFIGGSVKWKFNTAEMWALEAHRFGKKCHAGRIGTWEGLVHMRDCGVDSVDSSTASRNCDFRNLEMFFTQTSLF